MALPRTGPPLQEMPPSGGYPQFDVRSRIRSRGPPGWALFLGSTLVVSYGFYKLMDGNTKRGMDKLEKREARVAIVPLLQAEADVSAVRRQRALLKEEEEIMGHIPGWKVGESVYKTGVWVPKTFDIA
ncbi:unnamed protein product [Phaeothamnion confervicola]